MLSACKKSGGDDEAAQKEASVSQVTLTTVTRGDISRTLLVNGPVNAEPNHDVKVSALVSGRIVELSVAEGDRVTSGELVAKIDDHSYRDQVAQTEAAEQQAQANLVNANLNLARNEDLVQRGIAARKELEDARTEASVDQAALRQASAALSVARLQLSRTEIHSPISGTVVKRSVSTGEQVDGTAATPIIEVASLEEIELAANVPAADLARLKIGQAVTLSTDALPGNKFMGQVVAISQSVDPATNAGLARIRIPNANGELRLGMFLGAKLPIETRKNALTVPSQSIYRDTASEPRVFKVDGDTATAIPVTLGIETPDRDEITGGVSEGETIILNGGYGLEDKAKVTTSTPTSVKDDAGKADDSKPGEKDDKKDSAAPTQKPGAKPAEPKSKDSKPQASKQPTNQAPKNS
jgi:RND family efflux transporter MFP subunit